MLSWLLGALTWLLLQLPFRPVRPQGLTPITLTQGRIMSESAKQCNRCQSDVVLMSHFYICPNCMTDYATEDQMALVRTLYYGYGQDMPTTLKAVQQIVDGDKEELRLRLQAQRNLSTVLTLINTGD